MESQSLPRLARLIFFTAPVLSLLFLCLTLCQPVSISLHNHCQSVFVSLSLSFLLCPCVFSRPPGCAPLRSSQPFGDCALGLTDVANSPTITRPHYHPPHHLKQNHPPLDCITTTVCVVFQPAKHR